MSGTYLDVSIGGGGGGGGGGSAFYADPAANFGALPGTDATGTHRITLDTGSAYWWNGASWQLTRSGVNSTQHTDTDSVDMTVTNGVVSSDLKLSADAATASFLKATTTIKSGANAGLHVELPYADTSTVGVLTDTDWDTFNNKVPTSVAINTTAPITGGGDLSASRTLAMAQAASGVNGFLDGADWDTFNAKEPAVTATNVNEYYRGNKTFALHDINSVVPTVDASAPTAGKINEIITATQAANTATGIGATGTWGAATSISLTAGRWVVRGSAGLSEQTANLADFLAAAISDSATGIGLSEFDTTQMPCLISSTADMIIPTPSIFVNINATTTYYLNTKFTYDAGAPQHRGKIWAERIG